MEVPALQDVIQKYGKILESPEIRVWCHPHYIDARGDDYYEVFDSFKEALNFINENADAETQPLIAFRGYELNIFEIKPLSKRKE